MLFLYEGTGLSGFQKDGVNYYYLRNGQNDIIGILDASGNRVVSYTYDAWGKLLTTTGSMASTLGAQNPFRYRGYYFDTESGLYYLQSRYYDPNTGRFINADGQFDEEAGILGFNLYLYCSNNSIIYSDPTGYGLTYVFYYNNPGSGFKDQATNSPYYNSKSQNVRLVSVISVSDFKKGWNSMSGTIDNVYLYLHGGVGVLYFKNETMTISQIKNLNSK